MGWRSGAIVIGGGPAGLLAGVHLAAAGMATAVLEAKARLGGRALPRRLRAAGAPRRRDRSAGLEPRRRSALHPGRRAARRHRRIRGSAALRSTTFTRSDEELATTSVSEWLDDSFDGAAREAAAAFVRLTTFVAGHDRFSADVAALQFRNALSSGVRYLEGGWQALVDALAAQASRRGVTLRTRAAVCGLREESGRWTVSLADEELCADTVIVAVGGHRATARLLGERTPAASGPPAHLPRSPLAARPARSAAPDRGQLQPRPALRAGGDVRPRPARMA